MDVITDPYKLAHSLSGQMWIDGRFASSLSSRTFLVRNPATGTVIAEVPFAEQADVDSAVNAAVAAQKKWARVPARQRGKLIAECGRRLASHVEELGRLVSLETGKALRTESRLEASALADIFDFFGGLASELKGETVPFNPDMLTMTLREPVGVVGVIIPWNAPLLLMALKIAPALVAGNAVVVKAAEEAPLAVLRVAQIMSEVLPAGLFNLLTGYGPECGAPLVSHKDVRKITFTGSVDTGKIVYRLAADKLIPATLELGGKSPMIVMADADLDRAVAGAVSGMRFTRQGQSCTAASRIFVQSTVHDRFVERLVATVDQMKMGDPLSEDTDIGTVISKEQFDRVRRYIDLGLSEFGSKAYPCSNLPVDPIFSDGLFIRPHIFTGINNSSRLAQEEIFGPVCCVISFENYDDAISAANDSEFGLAATIWTSDLRTALDATRRLEAGFVQVNQNLVVQPGLSYGGTKASGLGKEASLESMLAHFTTQKTVIINLL